MSDYALEQLVPAEGCRRLFIFYTIISLLTIMGLCSANLAPIEISALVGKMGSTVNQAGLIVSLELVVVAITSLFLASKLNEANSLPLAFIAAGLCVLLNIISGLAQSLVTFTVLRALTGLASGTLWAINCYWCGRSAKGVRAMGIAMVSITAVSAGGMAMLPGLALQHGVMAPCFFLALLALATLSALVFMKIPAFARPALSSGQNAQQRPHSRSWLLFSVLAVIALSNGAGQNLWTYSDQLGALVGVVVDDMAVVLSVAMLISMVGSALAAFVGDKLGITVPLFIGLVFTGSACALMGFAQGAWSLGICLSLAQIGFFFMMPLQIGAAARVDPSGRSSALAGGAVLLAGAVAPFFGGVMFANVSPIAVAWMCAAMYWLAAALSLTLRRISH